MSSQTDVVNQTLLLLGADTIAAVDNETPNGRIFNLLWTPQRDAVTRAHPWNFAMSQASVAVDATAPTYKWAKSYTLPPDPYCLRVWELEDPKAPYEVQGRKILTDEGAPLKFDFISRVTDPEQFDPLFEQCLAARMAFMTAFRIAKSRSLRADMWKVYNDILVEARSIDGQEGGPRTFGADDFLDSRL